MQDKKTAVILFNLGGPDSPDAVKPFLFNLFNDKAIISLPNPFRYFLAKLISSKRAPFAKEIYHHLGGKSPILEETQKQAESLEKKLGNNYRVFIAMRYWKPFADETVARVKKYNPDEVVLLPLYPQFSTSTTASSIKDWNENAIKQGLKTSTRIICCYPDEDNFINSHVELLENAYQKISDKNNVRILFSAHGLPKRTIQKGDPYQFQVELTAKKIMEKFTAENAEWLVCYQSKVGRLEWIGPATDDEIKRADSDKKSVIIVPIAFVSEHSETLVELDIEYKELITTQYIRVPTLSINDKYIESLANICRNSSKAANPCSYNGNRICPSFFVKCAMNG